MRSRPKSTLSGLHRKTREDARYSWLGKWSRAKANVGLEPKGHFPRSGRRSRSAVNKSGRDGISTGRVALQGALQFPRHLLIWLNHQHVSKIVHHRHNAISWPNTPNHLTMVVEIEVYDVADICSHKIIIVFYA